MRPFATLAHIAGYAKARLGEGSTWTAIGAGAIAVAALASPWSYVGFGCAVLAAMVPNRGKDGQ